MENANYRINITKWLPFPSPELESWFNETLEACDIGEEYSQNIVEITVAIRDADKITPKQVNIIIYPIRNLIN